MKHNEKTLVTGATGLSGAAFIKRLESSEAIGLSRSNQKVNFFEKSNYDIDDVDRIAEKYSVKKIIHCAGVPSVFSSLKNPYLDKINNLDPFFFSLELARKTKSQLILISSPEVYGQPNKDELAQLNPKNFYGISKLCCEKYLKLYAELYHFEYQIFRPTILYNATPSKRGLLFDIWQSFEMKKKKVEIFCTKNSLLNFVHVDDLAEVVFKVMESGPKNNIWNIMGNQSVTPLELTEMFSELYAIKKDIHVLESNLQKKIVNDDKIRSFGWSPSHNLLQDIKEMTGK